MENPDPKFVALDLLDLVELPRLQFPEEYFWVFADALPREQVPVVWRDADAGYRALALRLEVLCLLVLLDIVIDDERARRVEQLPCQVIECDLLAVLNSEPDDVFRVDVCGFFLLAEVGHIFFDFALLFQLLIHIDNLDVDIGR